MKLSAKVRNIIKEERLMFVYRGTVTNDSSESLLMMLEQEMEKSNFGSPGRKRLFLFVLESLQNVSRHSSRQSEGEMSLVIFSKTDNGYRVTTANVIAREESLPLKAQLDLMNGMDAEGIRNLYLQKLVNEGFSDKGGAGLGLIEMARKSGNRLDYDFIDIDGDNLYFILSKKVEQGGEVSRPDDHGSEKSPDGKRVVALERMMAENGIAMIWSGPISSGIGENVLSFTETRMNEADIGLKSKRKMLSIMMESLQVIARYNPESGEAGEYGMPMAMLVSEDGGMKFTAGNLISDNQLAQLVDNLQQINSYDARGLKGFYRKLLSEKDLPDDQTGLMSLTDIARRSGHKLEYDFERINENSSYYVISVFVDLISKTSRR